jgi:hypothetical protein
MTYISRLWSDEEEELFVLSAKELHGDLLGEFVDEGHRVHHDPLLDGLL